MTAALKFVWIVMKSFIVGIIFFIKEVFSVYKAMPSDKTSPQFESTDMQQIFTVKPLEEASSNMPIKIVPIVKDTLLKKYDTCDPWKNVHLSKELNAFINGPKIARVVADVSWRLGFANNISKEELFLFYDTCRFERTWHPDKSSPWCDVFTNEDMRALEFKEDLYYFYTVGPGRKINGELGCHLIRNMFDHFLKVEAGDDQSEGVFYFTNSYTLMLFLTTMGIGKDSIPLAAANFQDMDHRDWKISQMMPYAANIMAVFHRCDYSNVKVTFYLNEKPLILKGCKNGVCDWAKLKKKLGAIIANCKVEVCQKES